MDIDITNFFKNEEPSNLCASAHEKGVDAGQITWNASMQAAKQYVLLDTAEKREAFRRWVKESGGWSAEERAAWTDQELNALFLQWVSADMREGGLDVPSPDWDAYEVNAKNGQCASNIYQRDDGTVWFSLE